MPGFETWIDRQIREAQERGSFDNLPGAGKPIEGLGQRQDDDWWAKGLMERENIEAVLPGSLLLRREREGIAETVAEARNEKAVREIVADLNARIVESRRRGIDGPKIFIKTVDVERVVRGWRERRAG